MSKFTTEVRYICETLAGYDESQDYSKIDEIVEDAESQIFDNYPIFDETYRKTLNCKILKHYYTREICEETFGLWKLRLNNRMNEIMPYYNKLYTSEELAFNPLQDIDITTSGSESGSASSNGSSTSNDTSSGGSGDAYSDTPQGHLSGVEDNSHLTNYRKINFSQNSNGGTTNSSSSSNSGTHNERTFGKSAGKSNSALLQEYRETFLNIDKQIIDELNDLFFGLWD